MKLSQVALRNIGRNKRRSILSGIAIGVAAMAIVILFALIDGMQEDLSSNLHDFYSGMVRIRHTDYDANELLSPLHLRVQDADAKVAELAAMDEVESVSPRINFPTSIYLEGETYNAQGIGVDMALEPDYSGLDQYLVNGTMPAAGERSMLIGYKLAEELGVGVGDQLTLLSLTMRRSSNAITFTIAGTLALPVASLNNNVLYLPLDQARSLVRMDDSVTEILVKLNDERTSRDFAAMLADRWNDEALRIVSWRDVPSAYSFIELARGIYNGMAVVFFLLGSTVIITTTMIVIFERMREIGTIAAMGMTGSQIVRLFFLEALFIAIIAAFVGVVVGSGITLVLGQIGIDLGEALEGIDIEIGSKIYPQWNLLTAVFVFVYSVVVTGLASFFPSRKVARIEPVEALHTV
jgi:putative ABC transport system permease protein